MFPRVGGITRHYGSSFSGPTVGSFGAIGVESNSATVTGLSIATGSAIYVYIQIFQTDYYPLTIVDSQSNTYYLVSGLDEGFDGAQYTYLYVCPSSSGSVSQVDVTISTTAFFMTQVVEVKGALSTRPWDTIAYKTFNTSTTWTSDTLLTTQNDELILVLAGTEQQTNTWSSPSAGWSITQQLGDATNGQSEFTAKSNQSSAGTTSLSITSANNYYGSMYILGSTNAAPSVTAPTFIASIMAVNSSFETPNNTVTGAVGGASSINTTGASILIAVIRARSATPTITDSASNSWTYGNTFLLLDGGGVTRMNVGYVISPSTSATHTFNPTANDGSCEVYAFSGGTGWYLDIEGQIYTTINSSTIPVQPMLTFSHEVVIVGFGSNGSTVSATVTGGFNGGQGVSSGSALCNQYTDSAEVGGSAYLITSSAGANNPVFTASGNNGDFISVSFAFRHA
jgi:hypothetical protein